MATDNGYIKLFRKLLDWKWYSDNPTRSVFLHCLVRANYQDAEWKGEIIKAGSFITSAEKLGEEIGLSRQQVRRAFFNLQTTNEITINSTNKYTLINVVNWAKYQSASTISNQQVTQQETYIATNKQPTNNQQTTTDKELKKERSKELKNFQIPMVCEVEDYCLERQNGISAESFISFYESKGWMIGKNKMKDWKAAVRTWEQSRSEKPKPKGKVAPPGKYDDVD